ncbi:MAG: pantetheine-phosphate adenylyltransferase [Alkalibacterium sp.]|nr:pantetheine-phosphate adenylyltransferase [Alkalibacterium sp.]TVP92453.1 MAG: pantetheine-phosphate adenylyltransferase [Alkalibacterium sp.]
MYKGMYVGSFDPVTKGHINILKRASLLFDEVIVVVSASTSKQYWFSAEERAGFIEETLADENITNIRILTHDGLTVKLAEKLGITVLIRGIRSVKDMEFEVDVATLNKIQNQSIETVFLIADEKYRSISSSMVKEIAYYQGKIDELVPAAVEKAMIEHVKKRWPE